MSNRLVLSLTLSLAAALSASQAVAVAADSDQGRLVELPRAGFAITYPESWRLEATGADGALMHLADRVWSDEFCRAFYAPAPPHV
jgi:hypothetical protein